MKIGDKPVTTDGLWKKGQLPLFTEQSIKGLHRHPEVVPEKTLKPWTLCYWNEPPVKVT